ncbi:chondroitin proteoglycan-2-like [Daphnia carinata]|uniref:chondroitin proteoglycan-2-like n=1 Tax=Daphnia carinata TaxID=120202 RepID=UPI00257B4DCC|nr:chondroitin proteoglycan-2-like [Daphnia carinata]
MKTILATALVLIVSQVAFGFRVLPSLRKEPFENFVCPQPDGVFPSEICTDYYLCVDGVAYIQHCPGNSVYDPTTQACILYGSCQTPSTQPSVTSTVTSTVTPTITSTVTPEQLTTKTTQPITTSSPTPPGFICPESNGFFPNPEMPCSVSYYTCISGVPYISYCPDGSVFDPVTLVCVSANSASCSQEFECPADNGSFPVPGECTPVFYTCISGKPYEQSCPAGDIFDPILLKCVPEANASC